MDYPTGIKPSGRGLRISVWRGGRRIYDETVPGDPLSASFVKQCAKRREWVKTRLDLGLPIYQDEATEYRTVGDVMEDYLSSLDAKRSTVMSYRSIYRRYWASIKHLVAERVTTADVKQALASVDVSNKTKRNALIPLRGAFDHAEVSPNPAARVKLKRHQRPPVERYTPRERDALLRHLDGQALVYFTLFFAVGYRPGEALGLLWTDWDGEELDISKQIVRRRPEATTKTSVRRRVFVPTWARTVLNQHTTRFSGGHIFQTTRGGPHLDTDVFNLAWRKAHTKARIPYRIPYTCRHTRAAELLSIGITPADAARQMGHSVEMFLRVYSEFIEEYQRADKSRFEGLPPKNHQKPAAAAKTPKKTNR